MGNPSRRDCDSRESAYPPAGTVATTRPNRTERIAFATNVPHPPPEILPRGLAQQGLQLFVAELSGKSTAEQPEMVAVHDLGGGVDHAHRDSAQELAGVGLQLQDQRRPRPERVP